MILKSSDEVECECSQNASEMVDKKGRKGERRLRNTAAIPAAYVHSRRGRFFCSLLKTSGSSEKDPTNSLFQGAFVLWASPIIHHTNWKSTLHHLTGERPKMNGKHSWKINSVIGYQMSEKQFSATVISDTFRKHKLNI